MKSVSGAGAFRRRAVRTRNRSSRRRIREPPPSSHRAARPGELPGWISHLTLALHGSRRQSPRELCGEPRLVKLGSRPTSFRRKLFFFGAEFGEDGEVFQRGGGAFAG